MYEIMDNVDYEKDIFIGLMLSKISKINIHLEGDKWAG